MYTLLHSQGVLYIPGVFKSRASFFTGQRKLGDLPSKEAYTFDVISDSTVLMLLKVGSTNAEGP
jgi:hypothetical protein